MTGKFVVRLVDAHLNLLAWAEVLSDSTSEDRALCRFWPKEPNTKFIITRSGFVAALIVHWTDADLVRVVELPGVQAEAGQVFEFAWSEPVWCLLGHPGIVLPAVTVGQTVTIGPPVGSLLARP